METTHDQPHSCYVNAVMWERLPGNYWRCSTTVLTTSTLLGAVIQLWVSHTHVLHCREREESKRVTCVVLAVLSVPICSGVPIWDSGWRPLHAGKWVSGLNAKPRGGARRAWWAWMPSLKTMHRRPSSLGRRSSIFRLHNWLSVAGVLAKIGIWHGDTDALVRLSMSRSQRFSDADADVDSCRRSRTSTTSEFTGHPTLYTILQAFCWSTQTRPPNTGKARRTCHPWATWREIASDLRVLVQLQPASAAPFEGVLYAPSYNEENKSKKRLVLVVVKYG
jgi:hypothetical protein